MTTEKQRNFAARLHGELLELAKKLSQQDAVQVVEMIGPVAGSLEMVLRGEGSGKEASDAIDMLIKARDKAKELTGTVEYRWKKIGEEWYVSGPDLTAGETVTVTSSRGEQQVTIDSLSGEFGVPRKEKVRDDLSEGIWVNDQEQHIEVARTRNGHMVGKLIDPETGKRDYLGKRGLAGLVRKLTIEEAKEFGKRTGTCMVCARELTNDTQPGPDGLTSVERGIGPVCMTRGDTYFRTEEDHSA